MRLATPVLSLLLLLAPNSSFGFVFRPSPLVRIQPFSPSPPLDTKPHVSLVDRNNALSSSPTALNMVAGSSALSTPLVRRVLVVVGAALAILSKKYYKSILWPGSSPDPNLSEPLPPGSMGCPLFGSNMMAGSRDYGPYVFLDRANKQLGNPNLFKFYAFGAPMIAVKGKSNIKQVLEHEFEPDGVNTIMISEPFGALFGDESILYETDKDQHGLLRRLAGAAMTPVAIAKGVPAIQAAANDQIQAMLHVNHTVKMEQVCNEFTLDVAWRQILGLDLEEDQVPVFRKAVQDWLGGFYNPLYLLPFRVPGLQWTKAFRARNYLVSQVERKLEQLDRNGPDGSTLSGIYFATDETDSSRKLTRKQVIDNALILIVAGSETSASTLTVAMLLLGLHPNAWKKLKDEQKDMRAKHGNEITKQALDEECPYLDAVIKETLRIRPIQTTEIRSVKSSMVVDGMQIPKDWFVLMNVRATHEDDPVVKQEDGSHMDVKKGFQPERWLDPATKPSAWMPFGDGARRCLGERLAMTEMKVFLAMLARQIDFDLVGPTDKIAWKKMSIMARPLDGVEVSVRAQTPTPQPA